MVEKTAEKVKFDKEEDIKPLLIAFRKIFEPMTKAMKGIAKIPEEIERITKKLSKDIESGVPERTANAVEKIADNPELVGPPKPDNLVDPMEKLNAQLQLLIDNGIPAKIDEGKLVKLTEKEIKETQKQFIQQEKTEKTIKEQIETVKKSDMTAEEMAKELEILSSNMQKTTDKKQELQTILGDKTPQNLDPPERPGFQTPAFLQEPLEAGKQTLMAGPNAIMGLKDSFENNISGPIKSLIKMNKKHYDVMEDYGETGEKADKLTILKFLLIATGVAGILLAANYIANKLFPEEEMTADEKVHQTEYNRMRNAGVDEVGAYEQGERKLTQTTRQNDGGFLMGFQESLNNPNDIMNTVPDNTIAGAIKRMIDRKLDEGSIFSSLNPDEVGKGTGMTTYFDNSDNSVKTASFPSPEIPTPMKKDMVSQNGD